MGKHRRSSPRPSPGHGSHFGQWGRYRKERGQVEDFLDEKEQATRELQDAGEPAKDAPDCADQRA